MYILFVLKIYTSIDRSNQPEPSCLLFFLVVIFEQARSPFEGLQEMKIQVRFEEEEKLQPKSILTAFLWSSH